MLRAKPRVSYASAEYESDEEVEEEDESDEEVRFLKIPHSRDVAPTLSKSRFSAINVKCITRSACYATDIIFFLQAKHES